MERLPPVIDAPRTATPVAPPPGSPDALRRAGAPEESPAVGTPPTDTAPPPEQAVEKLEFLSPCTTVVPLVRPFRREGHQVLAITVRRLITHEISAVLPGDGQMPDVYEIYAVMTGQPAAVLRGLDAEDGMAVTLACAGFLPPTLRRALGFSTSETGDKPQDA